MPGTVPVPGSPDYSIARKVKAGKHLIVNKKQGEWLRIVSADEEWIHENLVNITPEEVRTWKPRLPGSANIGKSAPKPSPQMSKSTDEPDAKGQFELIDISTQVKESNSTWWKFAWELTIRNDSSQAINLTAIIEFLDEDGFVIDDDRERGLHISAGQQREFTGYALIDADVAHNVDGVKAKVGK